MEKFGMFRRKSSSRSEMSNLISGASGTIFCLPNDVAIRKVFTFLSVADAVRSQAVCKTFAYWSQTSVETYFDRFEASNLKMDQVGARALIRRMKALRSICLRHVTPTVLEDFGVRAGAKLRVLEAHNCNVTDLVILTVGRICLGLETLKLSPPANDFLKVTDTGLLYLAKRAPCSPFLREVSITNAPGVTDRSLSALMYMCPRLHTLQARHCSVSHRFQPPAEFLAKVHTIRTRINTEDIQEDASENHDAAQPAEEKEMEQFIPSSLRYLDLPGNHEMSTNIVLSVPGLKGLRVLKLAGAATVTDSALQFIALNCPFLEELSLANCPAVTDSGLEVFPWPSLKHLDVARCLKISDSGLVAVASAGNLETLDAQGCFRVTDYLLRVLGAKCHRLRSVNLKGLSVLTDTGLEQLCAGCPLLDTVVLSSCTNLGDDALGSLSKHCPRLLFLDLFCMHRVSDEGMITLAKSCRELRSLNVSWCFRISSEFLNKCRTGKYLPKLKELLVVGLEERADTTTATSVAAPAPGKNPLFTTNTSSTTSKSNSTAADFEDNRATVELSPLFAGRKSISDELSDDDAEGLFTVSSKKRSRRRSSSLHRHDSSSSLKKVVPGIVLDVAGSPRSRLMLSSQMPLGSNTSTTESLSALNLNDSSSSPQAALHHAIKTLNPQQRNAYSVTFVSPSETTPRSSCSPSVSSPNPSPLLKAQNGLGAVAIHGSSAKTAAGRRFGDRKRDLEREQAFADAESSGKMALE